jgi:AraC-like DNA-binding protein
VKNYHASLNTLCRPYLETITLYNYILNIDYIDRFNEATVEFPHCHHQYYEIYYVEQGTLSLMVNEEVHNLPAGCFAILSPGIQHGSLYRPTIMKNYFVIIFNFYQKNCIRSVESGTKYEEAHIGAFMQMMREEKFLVCEDRYNVKKYLEILTNEITGKRFGWEFIVRSKYVEMITLLLRNFLQVKKLDINTKVTNLAVVITKFMHGNYEKPITITDIAEEFGISKRHVVRVFQEYFGTSPSRTLTLYRLNYAKNYLIETDYSLSIIAERVGLSSASTLSKLFKENEGLTITQYREALQTAVS